MEKTSKYAVRQWLAQRRASRLPLPDLADIAIALRAQAPGPGEEGCLPGAASDEARHV